LDYKIFQYNEIFLHSIYRLLFIIFLIKDLYITLYISLRAFYYKMVLLRIYKIPGHGLDKDFWTKCGLFTR